MRADLSATSDAALVLDHRTCARLREALRTHAVQAGLQAPPALVVCERVGDLRRRLASGAHRFVFLEPADRDGLPTTALVREIRERFPHATVIAVSAVRPGASTALVALARAGAHGSVLTDVDDVGASLVAVVQGAAYRRVTEAVLAPLSQVVGRQGHGLLRHCLDNAASPLSASNLARTFGVHRRTLLRHMKAAGLPGIETTIMWCRLCLAAHLLEEASRSVEQVALALDFASANALRNAVRRYLDVTPSALRQLGLDFVLRAFVADLGVRAAGQRRKQVSCPTR